jgi:hypothetical protein
MPSHYHRVLAERSNPEPKTEYVSVSTTDGETCGNCEYFKSPNECSGPNMIKLSAQPKLKDGNVKVAEGGHCKFWDGK